MDYPGLAPNRRTVRIVGRGRDASSGQSGKDYSTLTADNTKSQDIFTFFTRNAITQITDMKNGKRIWHESKELEQKCP